MNKQEIIDKLIQFGYAVISDFSYYPPPNEGETYTETRLSNGPITVVIQGNGNLLGVESHINKSVVPLIHSSTIFGRDVRNFSIFIDLISEYRKIFTFNEQGPVTQKLQFRK